MATPTSIRLDSWSENDLGLLERLNAPEMTEHLGGPESPEKLADRLRRYIAASQSDNAHAFRIMVEPEGAAVGFVGFWEIEWKGALVYEMGWSVVPEYQGRGIASAAAATVVALAGTNAKFDSIHAFPSVDNGPSNGICRRLGFQLLGECDVEYPKGRWMRVNDWQMALR